MQSRLSRALGRDVTVKDFWGNYLYDIADIPFTIDRTPEIFTQFRKLMEYRGTVRSYLPEPSGLKPQGPPLEGLDEDVTLPSLGFTEPPSVPPTVPQGSPPGHMDFQGGETAALARLKHYFWDADLLKVYKETRNGLLGPDYSSKFAPW